MLVVDTHCHTSRYWYEPVETLLDVMSRNGVDQASLIQLGCVYDNAYLIECVRRFPGRFSAVVNIETDRPDAPQQLEELVRQGAEGIRMDCTARSPGRDPLAIWHRAAELGIVISVQGSVGDLASPDFESIVRQSPGLTFHIEHLGHGPQDATPPHNTYRSLYPQSTPLRQSKLGCLACPTLWPRPSSMNYHRRR